MVEDKGTNMNRYCLTHGMFKINDDEIINPTDSCIVVYAPRPELDMSDEWVESLDVPSDDELILMDMNAEVLAADFGVVV